MRQRIECLKDSDRGALADILVRNGYCVRVVREKKTPTSAYVYYIEYWKEK